MPKKTPHERDVAAAEWLDTVDSLRLAKEVELAARERLVALTGLKDEGTTTVKTDFYRIATTGRINRTVMKDRIPEVRGLMSEESFELAFRPAWDLSLSGLKRLAETHPHAYQAALSAIKSTPGVPSVKVELLEEAA